MEALCEKLSVIEGKIKESNAVLKELRTEKKILLSDVSDFMTSKDIDILEVSGITIKKKIRTVKKSPTMKNIIDTILMNLSDNNKADMLIKKISDFETVEEVEKIEIV